MHDCHDNKKNEKIRGEQSYRYILSDHAEKRRNYTEARISKRHLNTDHSLRFISAEDIGRHMNNTRIDGRTSKTDNNKAAKSKKVVERNEDQYYTERYDTEPRSDKSTVAEFHCKETVDTSAERYTDIKKACECGCGFGVDTSVFNKITARPK